jgi:hypothetical protein
MLKEAPSGALFKECKLPKESALRQMREFKDFKEANDPHNDHDFLGFVSKIDYYDLQMEFGSRPTLWGSNASSAPLRQNQRCCRRTPRHSQARNVWSSKLPPGRHSGFPRRGLFSCRISGRAFRRIWSCSTLDKLRPQVGLLQPQLRCFFIQLSVFSTQCFHCTVLGRTLHEASNKRLR